MRADDTNIIDVFVYPGILMSIRKYRHMKDEGDSSMKLQQQQLSLHEKGLSRVIPPEVLEQLKAYLGVLPIHIRVIVILLLECGLRVSELCALPLDCLIRDPAWH